MTMQPELPWIAEARKFVGVREVKGPRHNALILGWLKRLGAWWSDDETAWCATLCAQVLDTCKLPYPKDWYRAKAYLDMPVKLDRPAYGCLVIFDREGGGHVGFVVGQDQHGNLMVLGGNQGDMVCIRPFRKDQRAPQYRWPSLYPAASRFLLPLLDSDGKLSSNEA